MDLPTVWFVAIALLWTGYLVLEGFDFGVGMLLPVLGRDDADRRVMLGAIGPVWDGNEVWLITALGAMFAAFPAWYAGLLSGFYLPMLLVLVALIVRGVALEYRGKVDHPRWRARCDAGIVLGSAVPAFVWGTVLAAVVRGVEFAPGGAFGTGVVTAAPLLEPYALLGGLATLALFVLHGAVFLALRTDGPVRHGARTAALGAAVVAVPALAAFLARTQGAYGTGWTLPVALLAVAALVGAVAGALRRREGWAFTATAVGVAATVAVLFGALFPEVLPDRTGAGLGLTVAEAAAAPYTLGLLSWIGLAFLPLVLLYQGWSYWVFRARVTPASR
jgi:cytochrome d ubiquinol oxidase subunit II